MPEVYREINLSNSVAGISPDWTETEPERNRIGKEGEGEEEEGTVVGDCRDDRLISTEKASPTPPSMTSPEAIPLSGPVPFPASLLCRSGGSV
jgi:hypothetical protein